MVETTRRVRADIRSEACIRTGAPAWWGTVVSVALAALLLVGTGPAAARDPLFHTPSRSFHTGEQVTTEGYRPQAIAAVDLDGDGDVDAALANYGNFISPGITILVNNGDGTYAPPRFLEAADETMDVVAADLDADGDPDLAFAASRSGISGDRVLVYLNRGDGTFDPQRVFTTGVGPTGIAALDADGDGDIDLATANFRFFEEDVTVLYNDGSADFTTRVDFPVPSGEQPYKVAAGDLDGNGFDDLAVSLRGGNPGPSFVVLMNDGAGSFGAPLPFFSNFPFSVEAPGIAIADVDLDGHDDVLYAEDAEQGNLVTSVGLYRNDGHGNLGAPEAIATSGSFGAVHDFAVADVTGDGWPDILGTGHSSKYGYVLVPGDGNGGFSIGTTFRSGETARSVAAADADGDGDLDVLVANPGSLTMTVHENEAGFSMPAVHPAEWGAYEHDTADIDLDGDPDLVTVEYGLTTLVNDGTGAFTVRSTLLTVGRQWRIRLADVNGDAYPDVLMLDEPSNDPYYFHVLLNDGTGVFGPPASFYTFSCGPGDLAPIDFDNDGDADIVVTEYLGCAGGPGDERLHLFRNDGSGDYAYLRTIRSFAITKGERLLVEDFDGDGNLDIVTTHSETIAFWKGHGNGLFDLGIEYSLGEWGPKYLVADDFDGDGLLDVATVNIGATFRGQSVSVVLGNGDGSFASPFVRFGSFSLSLRGISGIDTLDANGDGNPDLVVGAYAADDIALFPGNGDGTFRPEERYGVNGQVKFIRAADFDGDGRKDVSANITEEPPIRDAMTILFATGSGGTNPDLDLLLTPRTTTVPAGTTLLFDVEASNRGGDGATVDAWIDGFKPNGNPYPGNPIAGPKAITLGAGQTVEATGRLRIPPTVPPSGPYTIRGSLGTFPGSTVATSSFQFFVE